MAAVTSLQSRRSEAILLDLGDVASVVRNIVERYQGKRQYLMRMLQEIQKHYGYLPREALEELSKQTGISLVDILNVATFYHQFTLEPPGYYIIWVCMGTACHLKGNTDNYDILKNILGLDNHSKTTKDGLFSLEKARCFGACSLAPVIMITSRDGSERYLHGHVNSLELRKIVAKYRSKALKKIKEKKGERK